MGGVVGMRGEVFFLFLLSYFCWVDGLFGILFEKFKIARVFFRYIYDWFLCFRVLEFFTFFMKIEVRLVVFYRLE